MIVPTVTRVYGLGGIGLLEFVASDAGCGVPLGGVVSLAGEAVELLEVAVSLAGWAAALLGGMVSLAGEAVE